MPALSSLLDRFTALVCHLVSWFTLIMVLLTLLIVILRYGFGLGWIAMQESVLYLHGLVFLLGAAHTWQANEHVRVDVFYRRFSPQRQAWVDVLGTLLLALPVNLFVLWVSWDYVLNAWNLLEGSQQSGGLPLVFLFKTFIWLFAGLMTLQSVALLLSKVPQLRGSKG